MEGIKAWEGRPIYSRLSEDCAYAISFTYVNPWTWQSMSPRSATVSGLLLESGKEDYAFRLIINHISGYPIHIITHPSIHPIPPSSNTSPILIPDTITLPIAHSTPSPS